MDFDEVMFAPIQCRDMGRASMMPPMMMPGPVIYPYYGLQPLKNQPVKDGFAQTGKGKKTDKNSIKKIALGIGAAVLSLILFRKGAKLLKGGKISAAFTSIGTGIKNFAKNVVNGAKVVYEKAAGFVKKLFSKGTP